MSNYLAVLGDWVHEQQVESPSPVKLTLRVGPVDGPRPSADVGLETDAALGAVAVWETGEVEAEVIAVDSMTRLLVESTILLSEEHLRDLLVRVMKVMEGREKE